MKRVRAFTLIELLVVVAIIGTLIAIIIPSLSKARAAATRTKCATNLASLGKSCAIYAASNGDQLPQFTNVAATYWFHDIPVPFGDALIGVNNPNFNSDNMADTGLKRMFYCPSRPSGDGSWNYPNAGATNYRSTGYAWLVLRPTGTASMPVLAGVRPNPVVLDYRTKMIGANQASAKELALDDIISAEATGAGPDTWTTANFNGRPNHMKGKKAEGANVLCLDGHVEWRPMNFNGNTPKFAVSVQNGGAPGDWQWFLNP